MFRFLDDLTGSGALEGRAYLSGAATAALLELPMGDGAWVLLVPEQEKVASELRRIGERAGIALSLGDPSQAVPVREGWEERSPKAEPVPPQRKLSVHHFDPVYQALAELARREDEGGGAAREMIAAGLFTGEQLIAELEAIEGRLDSFPSLDAEGLGKRVRVIAEDPIPAALSMADSELYAVLGVYGSNVGPRDAVQAGIRTYDAMQKALTEKICFSPELRLLVEDGHRNLELAAAVSDLVAGITHHVPAATVAALMVRRGLADFCQGYWE